jgi:hypothetical protein
VPAGGLRLLGKFSLPGWLRLLGELGRPVRLDALFPAYAHPISSFR